jgi:hypothetical protein
MFAPVIATRCDAFGARPPRRSFSAVEEATDRGGQIAPWQTVDAVKSPLPGAAQGIKTNGCFGREEERYKRGQG